MTDTHLTPEQLEAFREEIEAELLKLERSMRVTDEGLKPVELDPGAVGRLSRIDELQNQAMTRNLREREEVKLGSLTDAVSRPPASPERRSRARGSGRSPGRS